MTAKGEQSNMGTKYATRWLLNTLLLASLVAGGCGDDSPSPSDGGVRDSGTDGGTARDAGDAGLDPDAGTTPDGGEALDGGADFDGGGDLDGGETPDAGPGDDAGVLLDAGLLPPGIAYRGAPPTMPDDGHPFGCGIACLTCHLRVSSTIPLTPHPERSMCPQCHLPRNEGTPLWVGSTFRP